LTIKNKKRGIMSKRIMRENLEIFAENLRINRKFYNLTQEQLAKKLGLKKLMISNYENCKHFPTLENLAKMSSLFRCNAWELLRKNHFKLE
jgi:transcriptional regulator with XRE-family HTH domain